MFTIANYQRFSKPIMDIISNRSSVRTYCPERLSNKEKDQLRSYAEGINGPFTPEVRLELLDKFSIEENPGGNIGTYGIIKGAQHYIAAMVEAGENDLEQLGYVLENFILFATSIGLGTCWLGGTFRRSDFAKILNLKENETMPIVTPIGHIKNKKSVVESFMRFSAGSNQRKPWKELFFDGTFDKPLEKDSPVYSIALEAVRLAPSASNKQPWRVLKVEGNYQFYLRQNKGYAEGLGFNIQRIDMGIAMCHFEMVLNEMGIKGNWIIEKAQDNISKMENMIYIVSWEEER